MTVMIKSYCDNNYYVTLELEQINNFPVYRVEVCSRTNKDLFGYPLKSSIYNVKDEKKAKATFNRYKRNCLKELY